MHSSTLTSEQISEIEKTILRRAVQKLNYVDTNGSGESLDDNETMVFNYWKERGRVRAIGPARFGEIYEIVDQA